FSKNALSNLTNRNFVLYNASGVNNTSPFEGRSLFSGVPLFICNKTPTAFSFRRAACHFFFSRSIQYRLQFRHI
ncbi:MAG: hypothetical protein Q4C99_11510, partial [Clostridia bacterium]|nr:hypothetical protein [Clostridia bacterium]